MKNNNYRKYYFELMSSVSVEPYESLNTPDNKSESCMEINKNKYSLSKVEK